MTDDRLRRHNNEWNVVAAPPTRVADDRDE
jgi:hypothetical protein